MNKNIKTELEAIFKKSRFIAFNLPQIKKREQLLKQILKQDLKKQEKILLLISKADQDLLKAEEKAKKIKKDGLSAMKKIIKNFQEKTEKKEKEIASEQLEDMLRKI